MDNSEILKQAEQILGHKLWCRVPFENFNIFPNGNVYSCCPYYVGHYSIGNIYKDTSEEIWSGQKVQDLRQSVIDGNFKFCKLDVCLPINNLVHNWQFDVNKKDRKENIEHPYPINLDLSLDYTCNVRCITCRDDFSGCESDEIVKQKIKNFDKVILPLAKNARMVSINGVGEVFASKFSTYAVKKLSEFNPNIMFLISTNGILFDEKMYKQCGLENRIEKISFSVHAATKKTYDQIIIGGDFDRVKKNILFATKLKKQKKIKQVCLNFVVQKLNYKEMIDFQKYANDLNVDTHFSEYRQWRTSSLDNKYDEYAVFEPNHPNYKDYLEIVQNDIFKSANCDINLHLKSN